MKEIYKKSFLLLLIVLMTDTVCMAGGLEVDSNVIVSKFPASLIANQMYQPLTKGYIDITRPPYNAVGDGITDDTDVIQQAITDAYNCNLVVFFPANKTFLVSKQLQCISYKVSRKFAFHLVGSSKGAKPVIKLKDSSTIAGNILVLFQFTDMYGKSDPARHYGSMFRGIDINMGNNPTVSALSMDGAQYCTIEDVKIYGTHFNAGIWRLPGSGGGTVNVTVSGGNIGILQDAYRPNPTITGLTLENQSQYGIKVTYSRGPVVITGFKITSPANPSGSYNAIYVNSTKSTPTNGVANHGFANLCLTDGTIEVQGTTNTAIYNYAQDVTINNVYIKSAKIIQSGIGSAPSMTVTGSTTLWNKITSYVFTSRLDSSSVCINSNDLNNRTANYQLYDPLITTTLLPGTDYVTMHSWTNLPTWEDTDIVNIVSDFGATPENVNDTDNDGVAIQNAIDAVTTPGNPNFGKTVFIPRGHFHISQPLIFRSGLKIIGVGKSISVIQGLKEWNNTLGAMIETEDNATGSLFMSDFAIVGWPHMTFMHIKTANTLIRDVMTEFVSLVLSKKLVWVNQPQVPYIYFSDNAGGKIYNLVADQLSQWWETENATRYNGYHLLSVQNTTNSLNFYQISIEHLLNSPQVQFRNSKKVSVYGFKYESAHELLNIINCDSTQLIGGSGNYQLDRTDDKAIIVIQNSTNILILNQNRQSNDGLDITRNWILNDNDSLQGNYAVLLYKYSQVFSTRLAETPTLTDSKLKILTNFTTKDIFLSGLSVNDKVEVFNMLGRKVWNGINTSGDSSIKLKINNFIPGVYVVKVNNQVVKFIKGF